MRTDVKTLGYPKWHSRHNFVEECAVESCGKRCCHGCAVTCRICGCHYCPDHQAGFRKDLNLCEECGGGYPEGSDADVEKLVAIEAKLMRGVSFRRQPLLDSEVDWLIAALKDAWGK